MHLRVVIAIAGLTLSLQSIAQSPAAAQARNQAVVAATEALVNEDLVSLKEVLEQWKVQSPENEEMIRIELFLSISNGSFSEQNYDSDIIGYLLAFEKQESQSLIPYYHALSYHVDDPETEFYDQATAEAFRLLAPRKLGVLERALTEHYSGISIWPKLENQELTGFQLQAYYNEVIEAKKYKDDAITVQAGMNFSLNKEKVNIGPELGLGYAWITKEYLVKAAFGTRLISDPKMEFRVNGNDVEVKDVKFLFADLAFGKHIISLGFAELFLTGTLSFRTQMLNYVSYYTALNEPVYGDEMQGNGYFAPGVVLMKSWPGSFLMFETKYYTSINKNLANSLSADQVVISLSYGLRLRENVGSSQFK
ncbi:MAG: hypothetical protein ABJG41_16925 [Cyclobacteriaceae bacterium]